MDYAWMTTEELLRAVRNNSNATPLEQELAKRLAKALDRIAEIEDI